MKYSNDIPFVTLTDEEKNLPEAKYYTTNMGPIPHSVMAAYNSGPPDPMQSLKFEDVNEMLKPGYLAVEDGYCITDDHIGFVACMTEFPNAKPEMFDWWFWWHQVKDIRYKIWDPKDHGGVSSQFSDKLMDDALTAQEKYINNISYACERVHDEFMTIEIEFVEPEKFGFEISKFKEADVGPVVCAKAGISGMPIKPVAMVHLIRKTGSGCEMRSRFWLGQFVDKELRKAFIELETAAGTMLHCAEEYNHLASFLPEIYKEFNF